VLRESRDFFSNLINFSLESSLGYAAVHLDPQDLFTKDQIRKTYRKLLMQVTVVSSVVFVSRKVFDK